MKKYDVIIIGAGPGGLQCAEALVQSGKSVLLLEKNKTIGSKVCAGGLTRKGIKLLDPPDEIVGNRFDSIIFRNNKKKTRLLFGENFLYTINREDLGQYQLNKLKNSPVEIRTSSIVTEINKDCITVNKSEKIRFKYLVGADGSNSMVRRHVGLKTKFIGVAFQYILPKNDKYKDIEIFLDSKLFNSWYAWIFPHKDHISIGTGYFPKISSGRKTRKNFEIWLKRKGIDVSRGRFEACPLNCDYRGYKFDNVFLVGDAAGLVSGFTGEGIYQAVISGEVVAQKIINPSYRDTAIRNILRERNLHHFMLAVVFLFGPLRNIIFSFIIFAVKSKLIARFLLRILT